MHEASQIRFPALLLKTIVTHTLTYTIMGILAMITFDYAELFARPDMATWMRQTSDPIVMAGPLFQPIRGLIFALVFYPFREKLFSSQSGWFLMFWVLFGIGILSTFGAASGSVEGMVYTTVPIRDQLRGWLEVVPQALLLSVLLWYWVRHPEKRWLTWTLVGVFAMLVLMILAGLFVTKPAGS